MKTILDSISELLHDAAEEWLIQPNHWLDGLTPKQALADKHLCYRVLQAACLEGNEHTVSS